MEREPRHRAAHGSPPPRSRPAARAPGPASGITTAASSAASWARGHLVPVAAASALAVGLVAAIVVFAATGGKTTSGTSNTVGSAAAGAQAATTVTRGSGWLAGPGARPLSAVNADVARLMAAERAGRHAAAATAAGARLAADARAALSGTMPPVKAAVYRAALQHLEAAGSAAAVGQYGKKAARLLNGGEADLMKVTAAADTPVPLKTPAIPEPGE